MADCGGVIDGADSIILTNTVLKGALEAVKMWKTAPASGSAVVTMNGGSMTALGGSCFYVTGTTGNAATGTINVMNGATLSASTGNLFKVDGSSTAYFTASEEVLRGNFDTDSAITLSAALFNPSVLNGAVNTAGTESDSLKLDATSTRNITADSSLTKLTNAGNIDGPGTLNASDVLLQSGSVAATLAGTGVLRKTRSRRTANSQSRIRSIRGCRRCTSCWSSISHRSEYQVCRAVRRKAQTAKER